MQHIASHLCASPVNAWHRVWMWATISSLAALMHCWVVASTLSAFRQMATCCLALCQPMWPLWVSWCVFKLLVSLSLVTLHTFHSWICLKGCCCHVFHLGCPALVMCIRFRIMLTGLQQPMPIIAKYGHASWISMQVTMDSLQVACCIQNLQPCGFSALSVLQKCPLFCYVLR